MYRAEPLLAGCTYPGSVDDIAAVAAGVVDIVVVVVGAAGTAVVAVGTVAATAVEAGIVDIAAGVVAAAVDFVAVLDLVVVVAAADPAVGCIGMRHRKIHTQVSERKSLSAARNLHGILPTSVEYPPILHLVYHPASFPKRKRPP